MISMRLPTLLICAAWMATPALPTDKKKPIATTKTTVQVGRAPKSTNSSTITSGFSGLDKNGDDHLTRMEYGYNRQSSRAAAEFDRLDTNKDGRLGRSYAGPRHPYWV
jgi:hypothetical protein